MSILVLLSGGLDSALVAHETADLGGCLFLRWGQPMWDRERSASRAIATSLGVPWWSLDLQLGSFEAMRTGAGTTGPRVVAARNLIFLSVAASVAAANGLDTVAIGCTADDFADYPDCRPEFIAAADALLFGTYGVHAIAPLVKTYKREFMPRARHLLPLTWTCYESATADPCGTCNACRLRAVSLA